jgi:hypothetical protein
MGDRSFRRTVVERNCSFRHRSCVKLAYCKPWDGIPVPVARTYGESRRNKGIQYVRTKTGDPVCRVLARFQKLQILPHRWYDRGSV